MKLLMIDNYDSFTFNLVQMLRVLDCQVIVRRHDAVEPSEVPDIAPQALVISPGPKDPRQAGVSMNMIATWHRDLPILGVCLGMQCINEYFGGQTIRTKRPTHGKTSSISHCSSGLFAGLPSPLQVARYHSLQVRPASHSPLAITAWTEDQLIMGISHPHWPVHGVQFHPESFLTQSGYDLMRNFLALAGEA